MSVGSDFLINLHSTTGISWIVLIPIITFGIRSVTTFPLAVYQRRSLIVQNSLRPVISSMTPILRFKLAAIAQREQIKKATNPNSAKEIEKSKLNADKIIMLSAKEKLKRQKLLFKENKCQLWKNILLPSIQIPLWIELSYSFRLLTGWNMDKLSNPLDESLCHEGIGWITDLSVSDPYMVLPISLGLIALTNAEWNFRTADLMKLTTRGTSNNNINKLGAKPTFFDSIINISRGSIIFLMVLSTQAPAALVIYWISSNLFSLLQNLLLDFFLPLRYTPYNRFLSSNAKKNSLPLIHT